MTTSVPFHGNRGRPLRVYTNSFEITQLPVREYIQYDVITPEDKAKIPRRRHDILNKLQIEIAPQIFNPRALYDGMHILYATQDLGGRFDVDMGKAPPKPGAPRRGLYTVTITRTAGLPIKSSDLNALIRGGKSTPQTATATNLLQVMIHQAPNAKYPKNSRAYFTNVGKRQIGGGFELWRGFFQSVRPSLGRMLVNIDLTSSAVYEAGDMIDCAMSVLGSKSPRDLWFDQNHDNYRKIKSHFNKVLIRTKTTKSVKTIYGIEPQAGFYVFNKDGLGDITIAEHFRQAHGITLRFPQAFGVCVTPKSAGSPVIIPAELCAVEPGQLYRRKIPQKLVQEVVKFSVISPGERLRTITAGAGGQEQPPTLEFENSSYLINAGVKISHKPVTIDGRLLQTPAVVYGGESTVQPNAGSWNVLNKRFISAGVLKHWAVVNFESAMPFEDAQRFVNGLISCCQQLGLSMDSPSAFQMGVGNAVAKNMDQVCEGMVAKKVHPQLVLVILPTSAADIRRSIKYWGDSLRGVGTQCLRIDKFWNTREGLKPDRQLNQYYNNIALKINARLGGSNSIARSPVLGKLLQAPYMIIGADTSHPAPGDKGRPSLTSIVWSHDVHATKYVAFSSVQPPRQEIIADLRPMVVAALRMFTLKNKLPPARIVFFRDGVSEGEFAAVSAREIGEVCGAFDDAWAEGKLRAPKPLLTFVVVGKRHHVRFFPEQGGGDRSGNCPAGFVADKGIASPSTCDFYLQSQGGLKGTSRPSHYTVLRDENFKNNVDDLQELAFALCHVYAKATRSVSIPAPVYYADLVCARASFYFKPEMNFAEDTTAASGAPPAFDLRAWKEAYAEINGRISREMFFL